MGGETLLDECIVDQMASLMPGAAGDEFRGTLRHATERLVSDLERDALSAQSLSFALHSLRGMCANVGLRAVSERAGALQLAALEERLPADAADELRRLIGASLDALEARLGEIARKAAA
ncbi:MAG: Hpt domain-containing protein [Marivibrio sp.]|uniref:Hpt domain-containing protein n=1 Tax=Marivibrio sp. TaxID=2039719 RepID=UPI0032EC7D4D